MAPSRTNNTAVLSTYSGTSAAMLQGVYRDKQDHATKIEAAQVAGSSRTVGRSVGTIIAGPSPLALDPALAKALQGYTPDEVRAALEALHKASGGYITDPMKTARSMSRSWAA
jgi:hypothetical protein